MENSVYMKKGFVLIFTIILVISFMIYTLVILENNTISSNLNRLKYLHLQATIHLAYIKNFIKNSTDEQIDNFVLNDERYSVLITKVDDINNSYYFVLIDTKDEIPIRLSQRVIK